MLANKTASYARQALSAVTTVEEFQSLYLGAKAEEPTKDNEGNPLIQGALYFNTTDGQMYVWAGISWELFGQDGFYLGPKSSDPTTDNEGNPLVAGTLYFNTSSNVVRVYNGTFWQNVSFNEATPFLATGTTFARNLVTRSADVINVKDFGAVGDGIADDTSAIQTAINAASGGKAKVYIPDGVYRITSGLTIPDDGITIYGDGFGRSLSISANIGTRILADFTTGWVITCNQACFTLRDIEIYGADSTRWASAGSIDGTKGCIYIRDGVTSLIERVLVYQEPGIGLYLSKECVSSKLTQVTVEYCKGHAYYIDDGAINSSSNYIPCGIITLDTCRAARVDCCALVAGDPNKESGLLSAYRLYLINNEFFFCGGNTALSSIADYVIRIYADNCTIVGSAVAGPQNQSGGNSITQGILSSSGAVASLVKGIYIDGRCNSLINNRFIRIYRPAFQVESTSSTTYINGAELRHTAGINYNPAISVTAGFDGLDVSNIGMSQVSDTIDMTLSKAAFSTNPVSVKTPESLYIYSNGDGLYLDPSVGSLSYYTGTTQLHRFGDDGTFRSLAEVRPINNNTASLGINGVRWTEVFAVNGTINTSDANYKQQIQDIPEAVLRAWGKVNFKQYKFNHAVDAKGDAARWHHGVIAQEIKEAFESEGLNPFEYGLFCYDEWQDEYDDNGVLINKAGSCYSVRYEELLILESAYIRWKLSQL
jgi:hypothetical protein